MHVYFFTGGDSKDVMSNQQFYKPGKSHGEETWLDTIRKSIKDWGQ